MAFVGSGWGVPRRAAVAGRSARKATCVRMSDTRVVEGPDDYLVLGLAVCYKTSGQKLTEVQVVEPLSSSTLENISTGKVPTSYKRVTALKLGEIPSSIDDLPANFVQDTKPVWGDSFQERADAAARTFKRREVAQKLVELGAVKDDFLFSTERKRILNEEWEPGFSDNVKQDISIDVYNREADELASA